MTRSSDKKNASVGKKNDKQFVMGITTESPVKFEKSGLDVKTPLYFVLLVR